MTAGGAGVKIRLVVDTRIREKVDTGIWLKAINMLWLGAVPRIREVAAERTLQ